MRRADGTWQCAECGTILDIPADEDDPLVMFSVSHGEMTSRTINYAGREIHTCEVKQPSDA